MVTSPQIKVLIPVQLKSEFKRKILKKRRPKPSAKKNNNKKTTVSYLSTFNNQHLQKNASVHERKVLNNNNKMQLHN